MRSRSKNVITDEMVEALEAEIVGAFVERLPELKPYTVKPEAVTYVERGAPVEAWVVARSRAAVFFISVEPEKFGVGFIGEDAELENFHFYPSPEIAVPAFMAAKEHDI